MSALAQLVLLLCACGVRTQDFMAPSVNIVSELGKIKDLEERMKTAEDTMQSQSNLLTELTSKLAELTSENGGKYKYIYLIDLERCLYVNKAAQCLDRKKKKVSRGSA